MKLPLFRKNIHVAFVQTQHSFMSTCHFNQEPILTDMIHIT